MPLKSELRPSWIWGNNGKTKKTRKEGKREDVGRIKERMEDKE